MSTLDLQHEAIADAAKALKDLDANTLSTYLCSFRAHLAGTISLWEMEAVRHIMMGREREATTCREMVAHYNQLANLADALHRIVTFRQPDQDVVAELFAALSPRQDGGTVRFDYTNHRGEQANRRVCPLRLRYGTEAPWYPEPQWLLDALDLDKDVRRTFAVAKIQNWSEAVIEPDSRPLESLRAICRDCKRPVALIDGCWDHVGEPKPRHPAGPLFTDPIPGKKEEV